MAKLLYTLGLLQIVAGVLVCLVADSAIHVILGAISFGFGVMAFGIAAVVERLSNMGKAWPPQPDFQTDSKAR